MKLSRNLNNEPPNNFITSCGHGFNQINNKTANLIIATLLEPLPLTWTR